MGHGAVFLDAGNHRDDSDGRELQGAAGKICVHSHLILFLVSRGALACWGWGCSGGTERGRQDTGAALARWGWGSGGGRQVDNLHIPSRRCTCGGTARALGGVRCFWPRALASSPRHCCPGGIAARTCRCSACLVLSCPHACAFRLAFLLVHACIGCWPLYRFGMVRMLACVCVCVCMFVPTGVAVRAMGTGISSAIVTIIVAIFVNVVTCSITSMF